MKKRKLGRLLNTKHSRGCICCCSSHISQGQLFWGKEALGSDPQWVSWGKGESSPFLPKKVHQTSLRCFPNSKNHLSQILMRLFPQKAEPTAISFCLQNLFWFHSYQGCMHNTEESDGHVKNVELYQVNGIVQLENDGEQKRTLNWKFSS